MELQFVNLKWIHIFLHPTAGQPQLFRSRSRATRPSDRRRPPQLDGRWRPLQISFWSPRKNFPRGSCSLSLGVDFFADDLQTKKCSTFWFQGIAESFRPKLWKYLLNYFKWNKTPAENESLQIEKKWVGSVRTEKAEGDGEEEDRCKMHLDENEHK